jgi:hypothetical protein
MPTRLVERSVPIALYDLGYNLGAARRLAPDAELAQATAAYAQIAEAWNRDQLLLLRAAVESATRGPVAVEELVEREAERVRAHDEALVDECDALLVAVERAVSQAQRRTVRAHARGRILSSVALAMGLASCGRTAPLQTKPAPDAASPAPSPPDLAETCPSGLTPLADIPFCLCPYGAAVKVTFDAQGRVVAISAADGSPLPPAVQSCLDDFFKSYCFPSLAGTIKQVLSSHCWVA